jgi:hypothetical protein
MGVSGQRHALAALYSLGKGPLVPIGQEAGWGPRAGLDAGARRKILCLYRGSNPNRPARSQTLYCLSYHGSYYTMLSTIYDTGLSFIQTKFNNHTNNEFCNEKINFYVFEKESKEQLSTLQSENLGAMSITVKMLVVFLASVIWP